MLQWGNQKQMWKSHPKKKIGECELLLFHKNRKIEVQKVCFSTENDE